MNHLPPIAYTLSPEYHALAIAGRLPAEPTRAHHYDAGIDLWCVRYDGDTIDSDAGRIAGDRSKAPVYLEPGKMLTIETGLALVIPKGWVGLVKDRSSVAKSGLHVIGGVVDCGYRGTIKVLLTNLLNRSVDVQYIVFQHKACAQLVIVPCAINPLVQVESLDETERGAGGFGSSDKVNKE
jgi:dUTP pyrophosphatase